MMLRVMNLVTGDERYCDRSLGPIGALATVYAQVEHKDWNCGDYEKKYYPLVRPCGELFYLANWVCAVKQD